MKKFLLSLLTLLFLPGITHAVEFDVSTIRPVVNAQDIVRTDRNIIFDASSSFVLDFEEDANYNWDLGDGSLLSGEEIVHTYDEPGSYTVILTIEQGKQTESISKEIFVYDKLVLLLTDATEWQENISKIKNEVAQEGTYLMVIDSYDATTAFMSEESLYNQLSDNLNTLNNVDGIAIWTTRGSGINALTRLIQEESEVSEDESVQKSLSNKTLLIITSENINTLGRIIQGSFNIIQPKQMVVTSEYELRKYIAAETDEGFIVDLQESLSEHKVINAETGKVSFFNSFSYLVSFMISKGIPSNTIVLLLMLPIIVTLIAILKQVIGITTFGVYIPSIITLSFLALGLEFGILILFIIIVTGAIVRKILNRFHLLHIPRVAIVLTFSTLIILLTLALGTYLGIGSIATIAVFPMLIMTTLAEKFVTALGGKGFSTAFLLMLETTLVSLICYFVVEWQYLQNLVLGHPEIILLLLVFNYILGRWTGLRVMEYVRFREVMKHSEE